LKTRVPFEVIGAVDGTRYCCALCGRGGAELLIEHRSHTRGIATARAHTLRRKYPGHPLAMGPRAYRGNPAAYPGSLPGHSPTRGSNRGRVTEI
jgi:hypothetical protein